MTVTLKPKDGQAIRKLIPLTTLSESAFAQLCSQIQIEEGPKGTVLFKQGDQKNEFVYLLDGTISLEAAGMEMDTIRGGSEEARFALAHQIPRKVFAVSKDKVRFIRVNAEVINSTTSENQNSISYEVSDMPEESSDDWMTTLLKSPIFQRLPAANLQKVLTSMEEINVNEGELVTQQGEPGDYYYIIKYGRCSLSRKPSKNAKEIKLAELKTTDTFGEDSLISGKPRNVSITMLTDGTLLRLSKKNFLDLVKQPVIQTVSIDQAMNDVKKGSILLDVRTPDSFEHGHIKNSRNAPFFSLRMQLANLDPDAQLIVVCEDGNTSEAATFLLIRHGFSAIVLAGGFDAVPERYLNASASPTLSPLEAESSNESAESAEVASGLEEKQALDESQQIILQLQKQLQSEQEKRKTAEQKNHNSLEQKLQNQIISLNNEAETARKAADGYRDSLEKTAAELANSKQASNQANQQSDQHQSELAAKLKSLESELDTRQTDLETTLKKSVEDEKQIKFLSQKITDQERKLTDLAASANSKEAALEKEISEKNVTEANSAQALRDAEDRLENLRGKVTKGDEQAAAAERTVADLQQQLEQNRKSCELLEKQKMELVDTESGKVESLLGEKQTFEKEAADLKHRLEQIADEKQRTESDAVDKIDQLQNNLKNLEQQIEEQNQDLESTKNLLRTGEDSARELQDQIDQIQKSADIEKQKLQDNLQLKETSLHESQKLQDTLRKELTGLQEELEQSRREQETVNDKFALATEEQADLQDEYISTQKELDTLKDSFTKSEQACANLQQGKKDLESKIERLSQEWSNKQENTDQKQHKLAEQYKDSENEILGLSAELKKVLSDKEELGTQIENLKKQQSDTEQQVTEARDALDQESTELQIFHSKLQEASLKEEKFNKELSELTALNKTLEEDARAEHDVLKQKIASFDKQQEKFEVTKSKIENALAEKTSESDELLQELETTKNRIVDLEQNFNKQTQQHTSSIEKSRALESDLAENLKKLEQENAALESEKSGLEKSVQELSNETDSLKELLEDSDTQRQVLEEQLSEKTEQYQSSEKASEGQLETVKTKLEDLENIRSDLESKNSELNEIIDEKMEKIQLTQNDLNQSQRSLKKTQESLEQLSEKHQGVIQVTENERNALSNQITDLTQSLEKSGSELNEARKSEQQAEASFISATEEIAQLEKTKSVIEANYSELNDKIQLKDEEIESIQEKLTQAQQTDAEARQERDQLSSQYEQSILAAENEKSVFQKQVEALENTLAQSTTDLEANRENIKILNDERDNLEIKKEELETESASLKQDLESMNDLSQQFIELQNLSDKQQEELIHQKEDHAQQRSETKELQAELKDEIAALSGENSEIQDRLASKAQDLTAMEEKLFAIRKENAILERHLEEVKNGDSDFAESTSQLDELRSEMRVLEQQTHVALDEKQKALTELASYREQNVEMKSVMQELIEQAEGGGESEDVNSLKAELEMVREQADSDVKMMQDQLAQSQNAIDHLKQELENKHQRIADLEETTNQQLPLHPELTAVDQDVFEMIEEEDGDKGTGPDKFSQPAATAKGKILAACIISGVITLAGTGGFLLGTEKGKNWLEAYLKAESQTRISHQRASTPTRLY